MLCRALALTSLCLLAAMPVRAQSTRDVTYDARAVVPVHAKLRFTTMIILPDQEEILDFVCGDKDFWIVSGGQNLAYVKPAKQGAATNLNLVTATGNVYSFWLAEGGSELDLKLYVIPDDTMLPTQSISKRFYTADEILELRKAAEQARKEAETARKETEAARADSSRAADERVAKFRSTYPTELQFPYRFKANESPFNVS